jgi:hypothetical protein
MYDEQVINYPDKVIPVAELKRQSILYRTVPDSIINRLKTKKEFEYANDPAYWIRENKKEPSMSRSVNPWFTTNLARNLVYIFFILVILYAIFRIVVSNKLFLFYSSPHKKVLPSEYITGVPDEEFDKHISTAIDEANYQQATRYLYLKALRLLHTRGLIQFHPDATNNDYLLSMAAHKLSSHFNYLTRIYDYVWYGKFPLTSAQFKALNKSFQHFYNLV